MLRVVALTENFISGNVLRRCRATVVLPAPLGALRTIKCFLFDILHLLPHALEFLFYSNNDNGDIGMVTL
jgi:hypothetical protein